MKTIAFLSATLAVLLIAPAAHAVQFSYLDPGYSQQIYAGPLTPNQEAGMAWTAGGNLLTRAGSTIIEHNLTANASYQGTSLHGVVPPTHTIPGLSSTGTGMTNGLDGYIYVATAGGLQRFDPVTWTIPVLDGILPLPNSAPTGFGWGITTLPDGRIAYSDSSNIYVYNPTAGTNTLIYTASVQIDDIEAGPTGEIALAGHSGPGSIIIINSSGTVLNSFAALPNHHPDGLAFGDGVSSNAIFSNNNDGSISKYTFVGPGYTGAPTIIDIASNTGGPYAYGDLAAVGPDCAFYVTQYQNGTPMGTRWDNNVIGPAEASIIRIAAVASDGTEICAFHSPTGHVPEPGGLLLLLAGLGALSLRTRCVRSALTSVWRR
jgi:hypothetical protein